MRKRMYTTGLAVMCGLVLTATGLWASAASEAEPAAAADREMVRDPSTGQMILKPQYGGSIAQGWTRLGEHADTWWGGGARELVTLVLEKMGIADWATTGTNMILNRGLLLCLSSEDCLPKATIYPRTALLLPSTFARAFTGRTSPR